MKFDPSDLKDSRVVTYTKNWQYLNNYVLEDRAGVYLFANAETHIKYIGSAGGGRLAAEVGDAIRRGKDYGATWVLALYTNSTENARALERDLIAKYCPPNNVQGTAACGLPRAGGYTSRSY